MAKRTFKPKKHNQYTMICDKCQTVFTSSSNPARCPNGECEGGYVYYENTIKIIAEIIHGIELSVARQREAVRILSDEVDKINEKLKDIYETEEADEGSEDREGEPGVVEEPAGPDGSETVEA